MRQCFLNSSTNIQSEEKMLEDAGSGVEDRKNRNGGASWLQAITCWLLGAALLLAGIGHLTWLRVEFQAQVPQWVPLDADLVVVLSGIVEIALGIGLIALPKKRVMLGWITAVFLILIFPGNISQYVNQIDAFGLDTDQARAIRLLFQPLLVIWALWSTGAWRAWRERKK
jgi:uncharacterized membrane protein